MELGSGERGLIYIAEVRLVSARLRPDIAWHTKRGNKLNMSTWANLTIRPLPSLPVEENRRIRLATHVVE